MNDFNGRTGTKVFCPTRAPRPDEKSFVPFCPKPSGGQYFPMISIVGPGQKYFCPILSRMYRRWDKNRSPP